jgi:hypothetical protein
MTKLAFELRTVWMQRRHAARSAPVVKAPEAVGA